MVEEVEWKAVVSRFRLRIGELVAGVLPPGVLNVVSGDDKQPFNVGRHLSAHADVASVSFTGSVPTGPTCRLKEDTCGSAPECSGCDRVLCS